MLLPNVTEAAGPSAPEPRTPRPRKSVEAGPYRIHLYEQEDFATLEWPRACDDAKLDAYVYQSREFLSAWLATMGEARGSRALFVIVQDREGGPILWLPLVVEREYACAFLRFPDAGMADYNGPAIAKSAPAEIDVATLWPALLRMLPPVDVIDFVKMPATLWDRPNPLLTLGRLVQKDEGYYLPIVGSFDDYMADPARKPRARKLHQLYRKLERTGSLELGEIRDPDRIAQARAFIEHHKTLQYRRTLGFSQFDKPGVGRFIDALCQPDALATFTRMTVLSFDRAVIGAQLDFVTPRRQQGFMTTFDAERFGFFSPGRQVQLHLIERAFADQLEVFDLGHGNNPYKHPWMTGVLLLYTYEQARSWRGALFLHLRKLRRKLPRRRPGWLSRLRRPSSRA